MKTMLTKKLDRLYRSIEVEGNTRDREEYWRVFESTERHIHDIATIPSGNFNDLTAKIEALGAVCDYHGIFVEGPLRELLASILQDIDDLRAMP